MTKALTAIAIANLKPRFARYEMSDGGCPGLRVAVFPSKKKSFIVRYRFRGAQRKLTLGPVLAERGVAESVAAPQLDVPMTLAQARELATKKLREAKSGHDPAAAKQRARQEQHAAEADTLQAVCEEHLRREAGRGLRTLDSQRRPDLELFYPALGQLPIDQIRRGQFIRVLDHIADERGQRRAGRALSNMKTLLNWHANRSDHVSVLTRTTWRGSGPAGGRDRVLTDDELRSVWLAAEQDKGPFGGFVRFVLLTATRRNEAGGLRRSSELSKDGKVWTIPGQRYKNGKDTVIPLSPAAQKIIAAMPDGDFVFSADGSHPLGGFAERKAAFDKVCGVTPRWTLHDLRRTARTLLGKLSKGGVTPDVAERCLGHAILGVRKTYDKADYFDEKKDAFEKLAGLIEQIVHPPSDNVLPMKKARRK